MVIGKYIKSEQVVVTKSTMPVGSTMKVKELIEDGKIGTPETGLRGFAGVVATAASDHGIAHAHVGITDPSIAPSEGLDETWAHFGITAETLVEAVEGLS